MTLALPRDVETSLMRPLTTVEAQYVPDLLDRAGRLLAARIPNLEQRVTDSPQGFGLLVADVLGESVARVLRAPDNGIMRQESEGNYSYSLNLHVASGLLDILDSEWKRLGVASWGSVAPATDGYAVARFGRLSPELEFQLGWPGRTYPSDGWDGGL